MKELYCSRRLGSFKIDFVMLDNQQDFLIVRRILHECVVVRAEALYAEHAIQSMALSDHFDEVPRNQMIPEYEIVFTRDRVRDELGNVNTRAIKWAFWKRP